MTSPNQGWWYSASTEQKLAQIDGAIECGLMAKHVAMVLGAKPSTLVNFASEHARKFGQKGPSQNTRAGVSRRGDIGRDKRAYLRGDQVDFWNDANPSQQEVAEQ